MMKAATNTIHFGFDLGSISINTVVMDSKKRIIENRYDKCHGKPFELFLTILSDLQKRYAGKKIGLIGLTGTGGKLASELIGGKYINEIVAQSTSVAKLHPEVKTVIEMGGEDSKLIFMEEVEKNASRLSDFSMNTLCAAGTGSFLDQQARRIGISIEDEFGELSLSSDNPPRIAGRCSVFAKSDMIHLQQIATPVHDIVAGLCFAVARNFISTLGRGKTIRFPVVFQGGVAANKGMVRAFRELLHAENGDLLVPVYHASMGALGTLYYLFDKPEEHNVDFRGTQRLKEYINGEKSRGKTFLPLHNPDVKHDKSVFPIPDGINDYAVYLGLDIGSLSTNVVLIDDENRVIARRYLPTASKPLDAIRKGMSEIFEEVGERVVVKGAGTTGSGRYLTGDFIGADLIRNEITAQATAAIVFDPEVDTIFEIGGQDSKYISIDNGVVVDFEMNKVCAAGTGSFLEEQAEKLGINIIEEFGNLALDARQPAGLGDRCTVFMESDLNSFQQKGVETENLVGGLAYSIVHNYIQKVVRKKRIGDHILFQGGVTNNHAVVAAFEKVTGKKMHLPPHFDVTGAIGAAILARDYVKQNNIKTRFKGFDISKVPYSVDKFTCKACSNQCQIRRVTIEGEKKPLYYGGRCEKYELDERKGKGEGIPNLFEDRVAMLTDGYREPEPDKTKTTIGIPRGLMIYYQQFPFWRTFFEDLGSRVVVSEKTNSQTVKKALNLIVAETCFPVEVMHGHIYELLDDETVDYVFTPFIINNKAEEENPTSNCNCPWVQSFPFMVQASVDKSKRGKMLIPTLTMRYFGKVTAKELYEYFGRKFKISKSRITKAMYHADKKQTEFEQKVAMRGREVLKNLPADRECLVIVGRPYNTGDPALNLSIVEKLINLNVLPVPMDFLPIEEQHITNEYSKMYWPNGQRILAAARYISEHEKLHAVYMGNFRCGPDSFLAHFFHEEMAGKPYMEIEIDEHSADAGMITRYEAFLDSLKGSGLKKNKLPKKIIRPGKSVHTPMEGRTLYFPYMSDASVLVAAACRSFGIQSESLPMQTQEDIELARKHTSARECFPMICTTGSFLKKLMEPGVDASKVSFFMPDHNGPCRFGQYNKFQRILFNRLGFEKAEIISPSNDNSYEDISGGHGTKLRLKIWKMFVAYDVLRKFKQEHKPYELIPGNTERIYKEGLGILEKCAENDSKEIPEILEKIGHMFMEIPVSNGKRKPVIGVLGEIFMRDNPFCSSYIIDRLEKFGAETWIAGISEWVVYSTLRYTRDSRWKGDRTGILKSQLQEFTQNITARRIVKRVSQMFDNNLEVSVMEMLEACGPYIHRHYDGDPAPNLGTSVVLSGRGISGIANIEPFTCMPGTIVRSVADSFRADHQNIPMVHISYDGQEDTSIELRLQAFMHQAYQYRDQKGLFKFNKVLKSENTQIQMMGN
ncbi:acyl-CoA dehydratase activase [Saccharicrinis sp. FJH62]|uniref:acyl-CoA dehydratase activase n=1 Tax=Saccharicrinis sp. FJH62 TaxID=3344657 RepID=UPI0035D4B8DC